MMDPIFSDLFKHLKGEAEAERRSERIEEAVMDWSDAQLLDYLKNNLKIKAKVEKMIIQEMIDASWE